MDTLNITGNNISITYNGQTIQLPGGSSNPNPTPTPGPGTTPTPSPTPAPSTGRIVEIPWPAGGQSKNRYAIGPEGLTFRVQMRPINGSGFINVTDAPGSVSPNFDITISGADKPMHWDKGQSGSAPHIGFTIGDPSNWLNFSGNGSADVVVVPDLPVGSASAEIIFELKVPV